MTREPRLLAIGDIHGRKDLLDKLLASVTPGQDDTLILLGDYVDRGPDSKKVVDTIIHLTQTMNCIPLKGNHEDLVLGALSGNPDKMNLFLYNGGVQTIVSFESEECLREYEGFFRSLKLYHEVDQFLFVHAGLRPGSPLSHQLAFDLTWIRSPYLDCTNEWGKYIVTGHTPIENPVITQDGKIMIDTGAVYEQKGYLTCAEIYFDRVIFHQVSSNDERQCEEVLPVLPGED